MSYKTAVSELYSNALLIGTVSNRGFTFTSLIPWAKGGAGHTACVAVKEPQLGRRHLLLRKCRVRT